VAWCNLVDVYWCFGWAYYRPEDGGSNLHSHRLIEPKILLKGGNCLTQHSISRHWNQYANRGLGENGKIDGKVRASRRLNTDTAQEVICWLAIRRRARIISHWTRTSLRKTETKWTCSSFRRYWHVIPQTRFLLERIFSFLQVLHLDQEDVSSMDCYQFNFNRNFWGQNSHKNNNRSPLYKWTKQTNCVALVRERTIPTELPPHVGEVNANFLRIEGVAW
jgi:hypothetical protein